MDSSAHKMDRDRHRFRVPGLSLMIKKIPVIMKKLTIEIFNVPLLEEILFPNNSDRRDPKNIVSRCTWLPMRFQYLFAPHPVLFAVPCP
jgi:hypothetical protein